MLGLSPLRVVSPYDPIRATGANHIKLHLKKEHQIKEDDDNVPAFGIRESFALRPEAGSSTSIPLEFSISDKTELRLSSNDDTCPTILGTVTTM